MASYALKQVRAWPLSVSAEHAAQAEFTSAPSPQPDAHLLETIAARMKRGDPCAYAEFADCFGPRFRGAFLNRGMRQHEAEDLAVSCIGDIARKIECYRPCPPAFASWAWRLAMNAFYDWHRARFEADPLDERLMSTLAHPEVPVASPDLVRAVDAALAMLKPQDQELVRMRYFGGDYNFAEIGHHLRTTPGATRVRHLRVLRQLATILKRSPEVRAFLKRLEAPKAQTNNETESVKSKSKNDQAP